MFMFCKVMELFPFVNKCYCWNSKFFFLFFFNFLYAYLFILFVNAQVVINKLFNTVVVIFGKRKLTSGVLEVDKNLTAHKLCKVRTIEVVFFFIGLQHGEITSQHLVQQLQNPAMQHRHREVLVSILKLQLQPGKIYWWHYHGNCDGLTQCLCLYWFFSINCIKVVIYVYSVLL